MEKVWRDLYRQSNGLRGPYLSRSGYPSPIGFEEIASILGGARAADGSTKLNYFRGYVEGREDYRLAEQLLEQDLDEGSIGATLQHLFARKSEIFGERPGLVINGGLQWSEKAQLALAVEAKRLADVVDDFFTLDLTLFIGSYGSTPFGAHIDDATHRTILFNLGPYVKVVKIWDRDQVERQFGEVRNIYDIDKIEVSPDTYSLESGDCFMLPSSDFHVGINDDVSTTVALVIDHAGDGALAEQELAFHTREIDRLGSTHPLALIDVAELAVMARKRHLSNCWLRYPLQRRPSEIKRLRRDSLLQSTEPFNLQLIMLDEVVLIYSRGRQYIAYFPISRAITTIREEKRLAVSDFIAIAEQDGCTVEEALQVIDFLLSTSGISYR